IGHGEGHALFDLRSFARPGPGRRDRLTPAALEQITRTVRRAPEVMVKVLTKGGQDLNAVERHFSYLSRQGDLDIETDDGQPLRGNEAGADLLEEWDLDIEVDRRRMDLRAREDRVPPKLVHKVLFSMPPGTPANAVLQAVRDFAREEFALKHRYAMVLHRDEPHPHVHMVIKALSHRGTRLNIRKDTLRDWRRKFAEQLRRQGVRANATERAVRGGNRSRKLDGVYRAQQRGQSTQIRRRELVMAADMARGSVHAVEGKSTLMATRREVGRGWQAVSDALVEAGNHDLAHEVRRFVAAFPPPTTDREELAADLASRSRYDREPRLPGDM
ncbi:MAG: relaxase/mobilization nuclease domain-containing protein, partial [Pirellulales bacterium]